VTPKGVEQATRRPIARLLDAYENGLMDKGEFEPRIRRARERLIQLEAEAEMERQSGSFATF
jgi:site-specific DNA recombinase